MWIFEWNQTIYIPVWWSSSVCGFQHFFFPGWGWWSLITDEFKLMRGSTIRSLYASESILEQFMFLPYGECQKSLVESCWIPIHPIPRSLLPQTFGTPWTDPIHSTRILFGASWGYLVWCIGGQRETISNWLLFPLVGLLYRTCTDFLDHLDLKMEYIPRYPRIFQFLDYTNFFPRYISWWYIPTHNLRMEQHLVRPCQRTLWQRAGGSFGTVRWVADPAEQGRQPVRGHWGRIGWENRGYYIG